MGHSDNPVVRLLKRPVDFPIDGEHLVFSLESRPDEMSLKEGQMVIKNLFLSLDPATRTWMDDVKSYLPPVKIGAVMRGATIGEVVASRSNNFKVGDFVNSHLAAGWCGYAIVQDHEVYKLPQVFEEHPTIPLRAALGVLGGTGLTAYFGLLRIGMPSKGDTVVVSAAAGATGSVVCQIAKNVLGCRVIGIAGGREKCKWLIEEIGVDAAIDYKLHNRTERDLTTANKAFDEALRIHAPSGVDVFFDNVGGWILNRVLKRINNHARVVLCGAISTYNSKANGLPPGPSNYLNLISKSARMEGFILLNYSHEYDSAYKDIANWIVEGKIKYTEDLIYGLENAPKAMLKLFGKFQGNKGKLIVDIFGDASKSKL